MKLLGISGTIVGSKTEVAVKKTLEYVDDDITTEFINLKDYDIEFCDGRPISEYNKDTQDLIGKICVADAYIFGTPIFQGSLTGVLKNLFDLIPPKALRRKVVGLIATGGTFQHYLVLENQLKPIAGYFRSYIAPGNVYLNDSHFNSNKEIIDEDTLFRLQELAKEMKFMQKQLDFKELSEATR
jgi:FAD reductase [NAD(P)H]